MGNGSVNRVGNKIKSVLTPFLQKLTNLLEGEEDKKSYKPFL